MGRIKVFSIKVALATMCAGKLMDKLRCNGQRLSFILCRFKEKNFQLIFLFKSFLDVFSQICDENGHMVITKFSLFLSQVLALPSSVYESPSFVYSEGLVMQVFGGVSNITVKDFFFF